MTGSSLGHYTILGTLGMGGMGEVYRAHDPRLQRDVALKLLPAAVLDDDSANARLVREARAAAALNHPSICTVYDVGEADGHTYIAMELVEGRSLRDRATDGPLSMDEVLAYGVQMADALAHAHDRRIVHRDLKPANVMIADDGRLKVLDFGLAKRIEGHDRAAATTELGPATLTTPGLLVGTLAYMSPEQLRGEPADARSDVWALGVVLYELASGRLPFQGHSPFEVSAEILHGPTPGLPPAVPPALRAIVARCLEKLPGHRYQRAAEVRAALEAAHTGRIALPLRPRITRPWLAGTGVVAVAAAILVAMNVDGLRRGTPDGPRRLQSLAVLPLANLSGDAAQDYFADGMTEVLSTDLARLGALTRVTARSSVLRFKGTSRPLSEVARELNVDALVTGSVLRSGNRVSVTAQLLDPASGDQLWSNRYDRDLRDVLMLRNEIVAAIVEEIHAELSPQEATRLRSARPVVPEAFEAYLKGRFHWLRQTREDFDLAERYFQLALAMDPAYAVGYAGLSSVWMMRGDAGLQPAAETFPKAAAYMARALELDPEQAELYVLQANLKVVAEWDWPGAELAFRRTIAINPNFADARFFYADFLLAQKRTTEWEQQSERALALDPLNEFQRTYYGWQLNYLRRFDEAIPILRGLLPTGPNRAAIHLGLWGAYHGTARFAEAVAAAREYFALTGDTVFAPALGPGDPAAAYRAAMRRSAAALAASAENRHVPAIRVARLFAHAVDRAAALDWLEKAYANHEAPLSRLAVVWDWHGLHDQPRFQALLDRLQLPR